MYEFDKYPWNAIGPVSFMWNPSTSHCGPSQNNATPGRKLWVWCHPSSFDQIWKEFLGCLTLTESEETETIDKSRLDSDLANKEAAKKEDKNTEPFLCDKYKTNVVRLNVEKKIRMKSLTGSLLRFCLTGPQSIAVLADTLLQANIVPVKYPDENGSAWWKDYYSKPEHSIGHVTQREFMETMEECQSPSELPPHCVVAMTTRDPRVTRPVKRTKIVADENSK